MCLGVACGGPERLQYCEVRKRIMGEGGGGGGGGGVKQDLMCRAAACCLDRAKVRGETLGTVSVRRWTVEICPRNFYARAPGSPAVTHSLIPGVKPGAS